MHTAVSQVEIFDLDGTLTEEFSPHIGDKTGYGLNTYSLWNLITRELVANKGEFDAAAAAWKKHVTTTPDIDKILSSKEMTETGIRMFRTEHKSAIAVQNKAAEITEMYSKSGVVIKPAIEYLEYRLKEGVLCVISTASYEDGAVGFVQGLVQCKLLPEDLAGKIVVSGTQVDWGKLCVTHMNVDDNKLHGLEQALQIPMANIRSNIVAVFGDDPMINDRALLALAKHSFVIKSDKNKDAVLPSNCVFANWEEIFFNKHAIPSLHAKLLSHKST